MHERASVRPPPNRGVADDWPGGRQGGAEGAYAAARAFPRGAHSRVKVTLGMADTVRALPDGKELRPDPLCNRTGPRSSGMPLPAAQRVLHCSRTAGRLEARLPNQLVYAVKPRIGAAVV